MKIDDAELKYLQKLNARYEFAHAVLDSYLQHLYEIYELTPPAGYNINIRTGEISHASTSQIPSINGELEANTDPSIISQHEISSETLGTGGN